MRVCIFATPPPCEGREEGLGREPQELGKPRAGGTPARPALCNPRQGAGQPQTGASGTSMGMGTGQGLAGHQGCGELGTITPTVYPSPLLPVKTLGAALSRYPGDALCEAQSPQEMLSHRAGMVAPPGVPLGWSHSPVTLPRNASFNMEEVMRGSSPGLPSLLRAWVPACPPKQMAEQTGDPETGDVQTPAQALSSHPFFGTTGPGAATLPCVFTPSSLWGLLQASELACLLKKDTSLPGDKQMFLSPGCRGQPGVTTHRARATHRRCFLKGTE